MLLIETIRKIENEVEDVKDDTVYAGYNYHDWTTQATKQITLSATTLIGLFFYGSLWTVGSGTTIRGGARVLLDGVPLVTMHTSGSSASANQVGTLSRSVLMILGAGTYTFDFQTAFYIAGTPASEAMRVHGIRIGRFDFPDDSYSSVDSGVTSIPATTETLLATINLTVPVTRKTVLGDIRKYTCIVTVYAEKEADRVTRMRNVGDSDLASFFNCKVFFDDVQVSWDEREDDYNSVSSNPTYGEGSYGRTTTNFNPNTSHTVKIKIYSGFGTAQNARVVVSLVLCPWLLGPSTALSEPVDFSFPQGSTLYLVLEPLMENPTKNVYLGRGRGISWGVSNDYFSTASGVDRISYNYTFDYVEPSATLVRLSGLGGAITVMGVDVR